MNFDYFQIQKWILQTVRAEKVDEIIIKKKNAVIRLVSMFPSWVMVCKLSKKVHILDFCADLSKKPTSLKAIYIYESHYTLSENAMVYRGLSQRSRDISD